MKHSSNASYLVQDGITGDWIIVAPARRHRPDGHSGNAANPFSPRGLKEQKILAVYANNGFTVSAIKNNFPILREDEGVRGRQELLIEGDRIRSFASFTPREIRAVIEAYVERSREFRRDPRLNYIVLFKNEGVDAGASQPHPHSQIYAMESVPLRVQRKSRHDLHRMALNDATPARTIYKDKHVVAFTNPSGRFAYEVRIVPRRHIDNITQTTPAERLSLAKALHRLTPLIRRHGFAFNYFFHDIFADTKEPFEIRFAPRGSRWGGFELDAGVYVNPVPAEAAAAEYRAAR